MTLASGNHVADLADRPGENDQQDMHDEEADRSQRQKMKCRLRADCRPPNNSTSQPKVGSIPGLMAMPVKIIIGRNTPSTSP